MRFSDPISLKDLANFLGIPFDGDGDQKVTGINEIHRVEKGDLVFVDHPKYYSKALESAATFVLINEQVEVPEGKGILISEQPFDDFNRVVERFNPFKFTSSNRGNDLSIHPSAQIHDSVVIGNRVKIGENSIIYPNVTIYDDVVIGNNVIVQANSSLGADAFYYKRKDWGHDRMLGCGGLIIEDRVEIGACTSIDKGVSADTIIGEGTKIDNQVQVGHDTQLGKNCLVAASAAIAGCVTVGDEVTIWGAVAVSSGLNIGDKAVVLGQSGVGKDLEAGQTYFGSPAADARSKMREIAYIKKIPELFEKVSKSKE